jgi:hypothetical protein
MTEDQIKYMVEKFLSWHLPEDFSPDAGISFKRDYNEHTPFPMKHQPTGTNLFDYTQTEAMIRHMIDGLPAPEPDELMGRIKRADRAIESLGAPEPTCGHDCKLINGAWVGEVSCPEHGILAMFRSAAPEPTQGEMLRMIDGKFGITNGGRLVKASSGEEIPEWEPLHIFRARDRLALPALHKYREFSVADGCTDYHLGMIDAQIGKFEQFEREHPEWMKQPGVTRGGVFTPDESKRSAPAPDTDKLRELLRVTDLLLRTNALVRDGVCEVPVQFIRELADADADMRAALSPRGEVK